MAEVRQKLAEADQQDAQQGYAPHAVPASVFVRDGLDIEEQQYVAFVHTLLIFNSLARL